MSEDPALTAVNIREAAGNCKSCDYFWTISKLFGPDHLKCRLIDGYDSHAEAYKRKSPSVVVCDTYKKWGT